MTANVYSLGVGKELRWYQRILAQAAQFHKPKVAVVYPCDESSLRGAVEAKEAGLIEPILIGPEDKIQNIAKENKLNLKYIEIWRYKTASAAARAAVRSFHEHKDIQAIMKGSLHTDELMAAVIAKDGGLRTSRRISHVFVMDVPGRKQPFYITDAAINITPDLACKRDIIQNVIDLYVKVEKAIPLVAILSAVETINEKIPSTLEAATLCKMVDRGQIKGGFVDGPFAFDNAVDPEAARIKGIVSPVAGKANILIVPDLVSGNMLAKSMSFIGNAVAGGIVLGTKCPIILTSRADTVQARLVSCALAALYSAPEKEELAA